MMEPATVEQRTDVRLGVAEGTQKHRHSQEPHKAKCENTAAAAAA